MNDAKELEMVAEALDIAVPLRLTERFIEVLAPRVLAAIRAAEQAGAETEAAARTNIGEAVDALEAALSALTKN